MSIGTAELYVGHSQQDIQLRNELLRVMETGGKEGFKKSKGMAES